MALSDLQQSTPLSAITHLRPDHWVVIIAVINWCLPCMCPNHAKRFTLNSLIKFCHCPRSTDEETEDQTWSDLPKGVYLVSYRTMNKKNPSGHWAPLTLGSSSKYTEIHTHASHSPDHPCVDVIFSRAYWPGICLLPSIHAGSMLLIKLLHSSRLREDVC